MLEGIMRSIMVLAAVLALGAPFALAQTAAEQAACRADFEKLCAGTKPGGGRVLACLSKQKDKLSDGCRQVVEKHGG
jgi:hypothetical protein